jgi:hypothetical protein
MSNGQSANAVYSRLPSGLMLSPATSSAVVGKSTVTFEAVAELGGRLFESDHPVQPRVTRLVDLTHPAGADLFDDVVRA